MADTGKVLAAFVGGALIGAVAGLLLAPKTGAETRAEITKILKEQGAKLNKEEMEELCNKVIAKVKGYFTNDELREAVAEVLSETQE